LLIINLSIRAYTKIKKKEATLGRGQLYRKLTPGLKGDVTALRTVRDSFPSYGSPKTKIIPQRGLSLVN
jgi:hypothetical protein